MRERSPRWLSGSEFCAHDLAGRLRSLASLLTSMEILEFSVKIPWATMIATYIFLVAIGSGLCIINALGSVFGMQRYEMLTQTDGISITDNYYIRDAVYRLAPRPSGKNADLQCHFTQLPFGHLLDGDAV